MATDFRTRVYILAELWIGHRDNEDFQDYIEYNDLGLPLAYCIEADIVTDVTDAATGMINESFDMLLSAMGLEDTGWESLSEMIEAWDEDYQIPIVYINEQEEEEEEDEDLYGERTVEQIQAEAYNEGYSDGFKAEQQRVQEVVAMHKRWAKENKKGNEFMFWDSVGEVLTPIEIDYSEEAYRKSLEEDGF